MKTFNERISKIKSLKRLLKDGVLCQPMVDIFMQMNTQHKVEVEVPTQGSIAQPEAEQSSQPPARGPNRRLRRV